MIRSRPVSPGLVPHRSITLTLLALVAVGCIRTPTRTPGMAEQENLREMSTAEMRVHVHDFADRFARVVESSADSILARADDPEVRRNALLWKLFAIPESQKAAFQPDPLAAAIDFVALCGQLAQLFEAGGAGADLFGEWQPLAREATRRLDREAWEFADSLTRSGEARRAREEITAWVAAHPIDEAFFARTTTRAFSAEWSARTGVGMGAAVGGLGESLADLSDRLTLYADSLPRQARWQAQLLAYDLLAEQPIEETRRRVVSIDGSLERMAGSLDDVSGLVEQRLDDAGASFETVLREILIEIDRQRAATLVELRAERIAALEALSREREAALASLGRERVAGIDQAGDRLAGIVDASLTRVEELVDRVFWRSALLLGGLALVLLVFGLVVARGPRGRRETGRGEGYR